jgi:hypothetical protein
MDTVGVVSQPKATVGEANSLGVVLVAKACRIVSISLATSAFCGTGWNIPAQQSWRPASITRGLLAFLPFVIESFMRSESTMYETGTVSGISCLIVML